MPRLGAGALVIAKCDAIGFPSYCSKLFINDGAGLRFALVPVIRRLLRLLL